MPHALIPEVKDVHHLASIRGRRREKQLRSIDRAAAGALQTVVQSLASSVERLYCYLRQYAFTVDKRPGHFFLAEDSPWHGQRLYLEGKEILQARLRHDFP